MNFTFTIERPKDGEWGILQKNGSWTGMVGMLARQEIDFGIFSEMPLGFQIRVGNQ